MNKAKFGILLSTIVHSMDIAIYSRLARAVNSTFTIILSWQLVKIIVVHYFSSRESLKKKTSKMEKQHCEYRFLWKAVISFLFIFRKPKYFRR